MNRFIILVLWLVMGITFNAYAQPTISLASTTTTFSSGQTFTVTIPVKNFTKIEGFQFLLKWDPAILEMLNISDSNLPNFSATKLTNENINIRNTQGEFIISLSTLNLSTGENNPITLADGTSMFTMNFRSKTSGTLNGLCFSSTKSDNEIIDGVTGTTVKTAVFTGLCGTVIVDTDGDGFPDSTDACPTVKGVSPNGCPATTSSLTFTAGSKSAAKGETVCIPITVSNFTGIAGFGLSVNWDPTVLQYVSATSSATTALVYDIAFNVQQTSTGKIGAFWIDNSTNTATFGKTLANGTQIIELCFKAIGNGGTSTALSFTDTPVKVEGSYASSSTAITVSKVNGSVNITGGTTSSLTGFNFIAPTQSVEQGGVTCVPVKVFEFKNVVGFGGSVSWNTSVLTYSDVKASSLLPDVAFNKTQTSSGRLGFAWIDNNSAALFGSTVLQDSSTIFEVCFNVIGATGSTSSLTFGSTPIPLELSTKTVPSVTPIGQRNGVITVSSIITPSIAVGSKVDVNCFGQSTGAIDINVSPTSANYVYKWTNASGTVVATTQDISNVAAGTYSVEISGNGIKTTTQSYTIQQPASALAITNAQVTDQSGDTNNGSIKITVTGGTTLYSYRWANKASGFVFTQATGNELTTLAEGEYCVTITDAKGCTETACYVIKKSITAKPTIKDVSCFGGNDGSIVLELQGTVPANCPTYAWSSGGTTASISNLRKGTYTVTITCGTTQIINNYEVKEPTDINIQHTINSGAIILNVTGGNGGYTYKWDARANNATTKDVTVNPGDYTVTVTDSKGCSKVATINVPRTTLSVAGSVTNTTCGQSVGAINLNISGGCSPFTYNWSHLPAASDPRDVSGLTYGNYTVTVTDCTGEAITKSFLVDGTFVVRADSILAQAGSVNNGAIYISIVGGSGNFEYKWSNAATTQDITNLTQADYVVTVTDKTSGCIITAGPFKVRSLLTSSIISVSNADCDGRATGEVRLLINGGTPLYTIQYGIGTQLFTLNGQANDAVIRNLPAGKYIMTVCDKDGQCVKTNEIAILKKDAPVITVTSLVGTTGNTCNGSINITVTGGLLSYKYKWSTKDRGGTGSDENQDMNGLCPGIYNVVVTDANGCVVQSPDISVAAIPSTYVINSITNVTCPNDRTGAINGTIVGGEPPYIVTWTKEGVVFGTTEDISNIPAGKYVITIRDKFNTTRYDTVSVNSTSTLALTISKTNPTGAGNNGTATATATGGKAPYAYKWDNNSTSNTISGLTNGIYRVTVTDAEGCWVTKTVVLGGDPVDVVVLTSTNGYGVKCFADKNARLEVAIPTGGVAPFKYKWSNDKGDTTKVLNGVGAGTYRITVTDKNGKMFLGIADVTQPTKLAIETKTTPVSIQSTPNGTAEAIVTGGVVPYTYLWNDSKGSTTPRIDGLKRGVYYVQVLDANGCSVSASADVDPQGSDLDVRIVITPNDDGINDEFYIKSIEKYGDVRLEIFNRWGQLVYNTTNYQNNWKGTTEGGSPLPAGGYFYVLEATNTNLERVRIKGSFTIVRDEF